MAGCEYYVNGEWISVNAFKEMLNAGLLDNLVASKQMTLPGFKVNQDKVVKEETKEVINDSIPAIKLAEILANEIKTRQGYPSNMLSALELNAEQTEFKIPLWASPHAKKFESLLTSLVSNKVVKQKLFGGSYVLGSEEGVKIKEGDTAAGDLKNSNIVFSSKFDASQGLLPMRIDKETGKVLPAQIMIPFKFRNEAGEILDINEFTTKDAEGRTILDTTKIPDKLLQLFGFRIPTQERNSMAAVEIVGFLPEAMGDLILAPRDFTKQMGSDFDVDKLYTYMYNHFYKDGKLHTNFKSSKKDIEALTDVVKESIKMFKEDMKLSKEDRKLLDNYIENKLGYNENDDETSPELLEKASDIINQALSQENKKRIDDAVNTLSILDRSYKASRQNKLLDIHLQIMTSNNPEVIASVLALDSFGEFEDLAKEINDIRIAQGLVPPITTILSETYQRTKFVNATAGKSGVGTFSLDSTFNATAQGKDLTLMNLSEENRLRLFGTFLEPRTPSASEILEANEVITAFGNVESKGDMSNKYTLRSQELLKKGNLTDKEKASLKMKSSIIRALQSTAVDNEKAQILDKLNINNDTFDAIRALAILGFEEEEIVGLITQEIIWEYIELLKNANSSLTSYDSKAKENIVQQLADKYDTDKKYDKLSAKDRERYSNKSAEELRNDIATQKLMLGANNDFNLGQLVLLDKFLKLSEIGIDIKSVQSAINTESKGLPKSLIEVDVKVNQIKNLAYSNIFNATKLLGDVEGEGLNPTTINGYAAVYGTMFADGIFNKYFPYKQPGFKDVVEEVLSHTPTSAVISTSKQVSTQEDVFKDIRSYLYATTNTNLFNSNPDAERARLFIDTKTNQSLASILTTLSSQKWYQKNAFLNKLTPDLNKDGTVSTINFEAATGENLDEKSIYAGFVYLLDKNVPLGTFNGIPYTSRLLAQDLVAAAFLEGGNQGAKQYLKFVPSSYLKTIGFGDYLNDVKFNFEDTFKGFKGENGISYHQPSAFTRQYIQNNPSKAKTVTLGDLQANAVITPQEFTLNKEALKNNIIKITDPLTGDEIESQTHFLSIYDSKLPSNYALYEFDTIDRVYKQIPTLAGKYGFVQYNANNSIVIPVEAPKTKQPIVQQSNPQYTVQNTPTTPTQTFNPNVINNDEVVITKDLSISKSLSGTKEALQDLFNALLSSNEISPLNRLLLETYQSLQLPKNFKVEYNTEDGRGSYDTRTQVLKISLANKDNNTVDGLATTLAHELSHTFTSKSIQLFEEGKLENLTEDEINACKNLKRLQTEYVQTLIARGDADNLLGFYRAYWSSKLKNNPVALKQKLEEDILGLKIALNTPNITLKNKQNISKYYGGIKLTEFVAMALTDADFQQHLNEITDSEGVSWWDKIKSFLSSLISKLGFDVKKGSLLGTALRDSLDLIKVNQKMLKAEDSVFNTTDNLFTTKIDQFTYSYNPETNEVIHNAKAGNKIETNDTQINKVLVKYALANNYEQRTFNGSTYIAIADRVLNIKNANEVSPETWKSAKATQPTIDRKTYSGKVTKLAPNQIFVFGSNPEGRHGAGAAKYAKDNFGAMYGQGEGLQGQSYALPTKDLRIKENNSLKSISPEQIISSIKKLYNLANSSYKEFLVSDYSGTNLNGYTGQEMADMFIAAGPIPNNIVFHENFDKLITTKPSTSVKPSDFTNHSGGAYGGDTFWDIIGREFGVTKHKHYKDAGNANLSQKLKNAGVTATILSKEQMDTARTEVEKLLGKKYPDTLEGNLQVRNYYQVANSDAVYAIAKLNNQENGVNGGTNTAVQLGIKLGKPVYVWDIETEGWSKYNSNTKEFEPSGIPILSKNFAGIGSRDIENYNTKDKDGKWTPRKEYLGAAKEAAAKKAISDVYENTFKSTTQSSTSVEPVVSEEPVEKNKFTYEGKTIDTAFTLTAGQDKALKRLIDFTKNDSEKLITLQGAAGTGKTAVIGYLQKYLENTGASFVYMAPTHAATAELAFATVKSGNKELPMTVQSAILAQKDRETGQMNIGFTKKLNDKLGFSNNIIVLDEVSMLNSKDYENLKIAIKKHDVKVIFMGDILQIPEVNVLNPKQKQVSKAFSELEQVELTEVKRTESDAILKVLGQLRSDTRAAIPIIPNTEEIKYLSGIEYNKELVSTFLGDPENSLVISYTNDGVNANNSKIRKLLGREGDLQQGDIVVGYLGYSSKQIEHGNIANSIRYTVDSVTKKGSKYLINTNSQKLENLVKQGVRGLSSDASGVYLQLNFDDAFKFDDLTREDFAKNNQEVSEKMQKLFNAKKIALANPRKWSEYFAAQSEIAKYFSHHLLGADYIYNPNTRQMEKFDNLRHGQLKKTNSELYVEKGIDFGHAVTIHKSQGSTVKNVFVDASTLPKGTSSQLFKNNTLIGNEKHSLIYVAMSRASEKLVINNEQMWNFYSLQDKIAPGLSNLNFEALGNAGAFSSSNFNPEDYEGRINDEGPSEDDWELFNRSNDEMLEESPISEENVENYSLLCGK
jgi:hypothetical protein